MLCIARRCTGSSSPWPNPRRGLRRCYDNLVGINALHVTLKVIKPRGGSIVSKFFSFGQKSIESVEKNISRSSSFSFSSSLNICCLSWLAVISQYRWKPVHTYPRRATLDGQLRHRMTSHYTPPRDTDHHLRVSGIRDSEAGIETSSTFKTRQDKTRPYQSKILQPSILNLHHFSCNGLGERHSFSTISSIAIAISSPRPLRSCASRPLPTLPANLFIVTGTESWVVPRESARLFSQNEQP